MPTLDAGPHGRKIDEAANEFAKWCVIEQRDRTPRRAAGERFPQPACGGPHHAGGVYTVNVGGPQGSPGAHHAAHADAEVLRMSGEQSSVDCPSRRAANDSKRTRDSARQYLCHRLENTRLVGRPRATAA